MPLATGTKLGVYEIVSPIGAGGMGEVYRARDSKLDRDVAIKVLPDELASDAERVARFEREAKLLASLNHPNIASIYGFEGSPQPERSAERSGVAEREVVGVGPRDTNRCALVLELVEGPTLAERIQQGAIPVDEAIAIARQIADALEAGHEAGVIHRDLKPANVKVREDGTVKVLDYGLAKAFEGDAATSADSGLSQSPTLTRQGTQVGVILGTAAYMSPEQAKGRRVDKRTDVWAFGALVYEMLTGSRAFRGEDVSEVLASVIKSEPDWTALPVETPDSLRGVLRLCLTKDLKERARDIGDVGLAMKGAFGATGAAGPSPFGSRSSIAIAVATLLVGIVTGVAVSHVSRPVEAPRSVTRSSIRLPAGVSLTYQSPYVALSPDASSLVYSANGQLYLRVMDQTETTPLRGTEGARTPFFSPDSEWIGFWAEGRLQKLRIQGGAPVRLCEAGAPMGAQWGADDTIVFAQAGVGIVRVSADGGTPDVLVPLTDTGQVGQSPELLPGGNSVLFTLGTVGDWNSALIVVQSLETGKRKVLIEGGSDARYLATGHLVYILEGTLFAVPFDVDELAVTGGAIPVVEDVRFRNRDSGAAKFAVSDTGSLIYLPGSELESRTLVWVDRNGREEPIGAEPRTYVYPRHSPDGSRIALDLRDDENDIWVWDFVRETLTRLTFSPGADAYPVWTPDSRRVAFASVRDRQVNVYWKEADGTGEAERLTRGEGARVQQFPQAFSPDGSELVFSESPRGNTDLTLLSLDGSSAPLLATEFKEASAAISPNGRWLAYESNTSGRDEIYVRPFPNVEEGHWLISKDGGRHPLWAPNGRELFYMAPGSTLMSVPVETEPGFAPGAAKELFGGYFSQMSGPTYDISPDGERFLMIKESDTARDRAFIFVQNWFEELNRLVPTEP